MTIRITQAHIDIFNDVFNTSSEEEENEVLKKGKDPKAKQGVKKVVKINKSKNHDK